MTDEQSGRLLHTLISIETDGWRALSDGSGADYYNEHLTGNALMVFPFGMLDREQSIEAIRAAPPWASFRIEAPHVVALTGRSALLTYRATAQRTGEAVYEAFMTTVFVLIEDRWMTAFHQQSPVSQPD